MGFRFYCTSKILFDKRRQRLLAQKQEQLQQSQGQPPVPAAPFYNGAIAPQSVDSPKKVYSNVQLPAFDIEMVRDEAKGIFIIGDQGAGKTSVTQFICQAFPDYAVIVFDSHDDEMTESCWGNATRIINIEDIFEQMRLVIEALDNRDKSPLIVVCDDWLEILHHPLNKSGEYKGVATRFINLFSTKSRKFHKIGIFILHSPNVEAAGVDSYLKDNFMKVHVGRLALREFPTGHRVAYPCFLEGEQCFHPTHGHHDSFARNGKSAANVFPLNGPSPIISIAGENNSHFVPNNSGYVQELERLYGETQPPFRLGANPEMTSSHFVSPKSPEPMRAGGFSHSSQPPEMAEPLLDSAYTELKLSKLQARVLIQSMLENHTQTQIIEKLWDCKSGGGKKYIAGRDEYKEIMEVE